jgi:hypothetical protein
MNRRAAVAYLAATYGWDPDRVDHAILKLADHFGYTNETYYPDAADYHNVIVVHILRPSKNSYEISAENRSARLAATPGVGYTSRGKAASKTVTKEATDMATATRRGKSAAKATKVVEPEPEVEEDEDLEPEEDEEELDDEVEDDEEEDDEEEDDEEDEAEEDDEDEPSDEAEEDEEEDGEEPVKDYTPYASKAITPTMQDFHDWLNIEVGDLSGMDPARVVSLAGTLRMEFQKSEFCHERREERKAAAAAAKAKPAKAAKTAEPVVKATKATKTAAKPAATTKPAAKATKTAAKPIPGRPAPRAADRPATKAKAPTRKGKAAEAPF